MRDTFPSVAEARAELEAVKQLLESRKKAGERLTDAEKTRVQDAIASMEDAREYAETSKFIKQAMQGGPAASAGSFSQALLDESLPFEVVRGAKNVLGVNTLSAALGIKAPTIVPDADEWQLRPGAITAIGFDERYMFRTLPQIQVNVGETAVDDFRVTARSVSGDVERDLDAVTGKAELSHTFTRVVTEMRQFAILIPSIPNALLEVNREGGSVRQILDTEGRRQVENAIDAAAYTAVAAGAGSGGAGADIVAMIRQGIADLRDAGYEPDTLVVDGDTAAELDLFEKSTGAGYQFAVRNSNDSDPLFGLRVVEAKAATAVPLLYDSRRVGVQYLGSIAAAVDPFAGSTGDNFKTNRTDLRLEATALTVVRDAAAAITLDESS